MADLRPFRALRPRVDVADRVAAPPYDVVDVAEARALAGDNPDSFLHVSRPEIDLPDGTPPDSPEVHDAGLAALNGLVARGVVELDPAPSYSLYRQRRGDHTQTGVVACAGVRDYVDGLIKTHEQTCHDKESDRVNHLEGLSAHDEPVLLLAAPGEASWAQVAEIIDVVAAREPLLDLSADGIQHTLWRLDDEIEVAELGAALGAIPQLYVADGHHRSAAAARVAEAHAGRGDTDAFLAVVFPGEELQILAYHRVVADLGGRSAQQWLADLGAAFEIEAAGAPVEPSARREFGMFVDGAWFRLRLRAGAVDAARLDHPVAGLDVALLHDLVLAPGLGITDPRSDSRIGFVGGVRGAAELARLVEDGRWAVAFSLYPTSVDELVAVAATGADMPPKSTWFEPKLLSGLFVHRFGG